MSVLIRPATVNDFIEFRGEPPQYRVKAWVGVKDGKVIGMGGVYYPKESPLPVAWAEFSEEAYRHAKTLHKAGRAFLRGLGHRRLVCVADRSIAASRRWVERLGFVHTGSSEDGEVYTWQP